MSYVPRRTSTPIALCVIFRVAVIFDLHCLSAVPRHHRPRLRGCPHIGKVAPVAADADDSKLSKWQLTGDSLPKHHQEAARPTTVLGLSLRASQRRGPAHRGVVWQVLPDEILGGAVPADQPLGRR